MSNASEGGRDPAPVSTGPRAEGISGRARETGRGREPGRGLEPGRIREPGRPAARAEASGRSSPRQRIGIRELRQHASVYVDLAERGYMVDITNRGRLVAQLVPVREPGSPLERLIAAGIVEPAEESGGVGDIEPYPAPASRRAGTTGRAARRAGTAGRAADPEDRENRR